MCILTFYLQFYKVDISQATRVLISTRSVSWNTSKTIWNFVKLYLQCENGFTPSSPQGNNLSKLRKFFNEFFLLLVQTLRRDVRVVNLHLSSSTKVHFVTFDVIRTDNLWVRFFCMDLSLKVIAKLNITTDMYRIYLECTVMQWGWKSTAICHIFTAF